MSFNLFEQKGERDVAIATTCKTWLVVLKEQMKGRGYRHLRETLNVTEGAITVVNNDKELKFFMDTHELNDYGRERIELAKQKKGKS